MAAGDDALRRQIWRLARDWILGRFPPDPEPGDFPTAVPDIARPRAAGGEARITWVGHATALIQLPGLNVLTDPQWSVRCSPAGFAGPRRYVPAIPALEDLPPIDAVLISHDHYDHLDRPTVQALHRRFGHEVCWFVPLGHERWFRRLGIQEVVELDWWEGAALPGDGYRAVCVPARHWTRRRPGGTNRRLWCGWVVEPTPSAAGAACSRGDESVADAATPATAPPGAPAATASAAATGTAPTPPWPRIYFCGDSGYCPAFQEIGRRFGPFDVSLLPIGAYEPRWFMAAAHMNPEESVRAYRDLGGRGAFVAMHWGTWRLTFEQALEPPPRARAAWAAAGLPESDLHILRHGETLRL